MVHAMPGLLWCGASDWNTAQAVTAMLVHTARGYTGLAATELPVTVTDPDAGGHHEPAGGDGDGRGHEHVHGDSGQRCQRGERGAGGESGALGSDFHDGQLAHAAGEAGDGAAMLSHAVGR